MFCTSWEASRRLRGQLFLAFALSVGVVFIVPSLASAQAVTGTLLGNVTDSSGAAVPGATVTATEDQTNVSRTAVTNETGYYIFSSLQNGTYTRRGRAAGLQESRARRASKSTSTRRSASICGSKSGS